MQASITSAQALNHAVGFAAWSWRRVWGVQALAAFGVALIFVGKVAALAPERAADLRAIGLAITLVTIAPLIGALLRLQAGGEAERTLGPFGLQFGRAEARVGGAMAVGLVGSLALWLPMVLVTAVSVVAFRDLGLVELRGVGAVPLSFAIVAACAVTVAAAQVYALARLALTLPDAVEHGRLDPVGGWRLGAGVEGALCVAVTLSLAPSLLSLAGALWLDGLDGSAPWGLPDAAMAGGLFAGILTFVQAPLCVGVLGAVYRSQTAAPPLTLHGRRLASQFAELRA